jgi:hypothetical protein
MNFTRVSDWHEISDCGAYTVSAARVQDRFKFQAWKLAAEKGKTATLLGTFDEVALARQRCQEHREGIAA